MPQALRWDAWLQKRPSFHVEGAPLKAAQEEGVDPLACTLFLGSSIMLMGKMLSCTAQRRACSIFVSHSWHSGSSGTCLLVWGTLLL